MTSPVKGDSAAMTMPDVDTTAPDEQEGAQEEEKQKLNLDVQIESTSACGRHVTVTIAQEDVERYFEKAYAELVPKASVPGFRAGRAPRKLVEGRFKGEITEQVKGSLLMDSMAQVTTEGDFAAISEPDFDYGAIELERAFPLKYEFDIEVRPEFDLPEWKGLKLERPVREFTREDIDRQLELMLSDVAQMVPKDGPADRGDFVMAQIRFLHDGKEISECTEEIRVVPRVSFPDAVIDDFDKLMVGAKAGDTREAKLTVSQAAPNVALRGAEITAQFEVLDVQQRQISDISPETLERIGNFDGEGDLRDAVKLLLERQLKYQQQQRIRKQISALLTDAADWDLPEEMLRRQTHRELDRAVMELRSSGYTEDQIRTHENELRRNSNEATRVALKEHFILERIAENEGIEEAPEDYDAEIALIAQQSRESVRRVRARFEKQGWMDVLRNQIVERKVIALITDQAKITDTPFEIPGETTFAVDHAVSGVKDSAIPVAKHGGDSEQLRTPADRT